MSLPRFLPFIAAITLLFASCSQTDQETNTLLSEAETTSQSDPDSTLRMLDRIDTNKLNTGQARALYALLTTGTRISQGEDLTSDTLIDIATNYFQLPETLATRHLPTTIKDIYFIGLTNMPTPSLPSLSPTKPQENVTIPSSWARQPLFWEISIT